MTEKQSSFGGCVFDTVSYFVDQTGLERRDLPVSLSQVLELTVPPMLLIAAVVIIICFIDTGFLCVALSFQALTYSMLSSNSQRFLASAGIKGMYYHLADYFGIS